MQPNYLKVQVNRLRIAYQVAGTSKRYTLNILNQFKFEEEYRITWK